MKKKSIILALGLGIIFGLNASAADKMSAKMMMTEGDIKWGDMPPQFLPGAKMAVIQGNPGKKEEFTIRIKAPKGYKIAPHWHPTQENVTVISGVFNLGMGTKFDEKKGMKLGVGSFAMLPAKHAHFAWATEDSVVQVHGMGPFQIIYINKADDPSMKSKMKK